MVNLLKKKCEPCEKNSKPLEGKILNTMAEELSHEWKIINEHHLERTFKFKDFKQALNFTNLVGELAEKEGHHPDIHLSWGQVRIVLWTHNINGLSENDFILAAKIDELNGQKNQINKK